MLRSVVMRNIAKVIRPNTTTLSSSCRSSKPGSTRRASWKSSTARGSACRNTTLGVRVAAAPFVSSSRRSMGAAQGAAPRSIRGSQGLREERRRTRFALYVEPGGVAGRTGTAGPYRADQAGARTTTRPNAHEGAEQPFKTGQRALWTLMIYTANRRSVWPAISKQCRNRLTR